VRGRLKLSGTVEGGRESGRPQDNFFFVRKVQWQVVYRKQVETSDSARLNWVACRWPPSSVLPASFAPKFDAEQPSGTSAPLKQ
jgi:hypothetical protein